MVHRVISSHQGCHCSRGKGRLLDASHRELVESGSIDRHIQVIRAVGNVVLASLNHGALYFVSVTEERQCTTWAPEGREISQRRRKTKTDIRHLQGWIQSRGGNDGLVFVPCRIRPSSACSSSAVRYRVSVNWVSQQPCGEQMTAVGREQTDGIECCSPPSSVSHVPTPDDRTRNGARPSRGVSAEGHGEDARLN